MQTQMVHKKHGAVEILEQSPCLTRIRTSRDQMFWVTNDTLTQPESPEQRAHRLLVARAERKVIRQCSNLQFLQYVIDNYDSISARVKSGTEAAFEADWFVQTGEICDQPYVVDTDPVKWGLSTFISFPTPPAGMVYGDLNVHGNPLVEGSSYISCNDFFWQVIAEVKRLGSRS